MIVAARLKRSWDFNDNLYYRFTAESAGERIFFENCLKILKIVVQ